MLTVTMQDLYPFDSWNYVFGWANYTSRTGVFSFGRYDPVFNGEIPTPESQNELLENACYVMVMKSDTCSVSHIAPSMNAS